MISENINSSFFKDKITDTKNKGTLSLLEEWLSKSYKATNKDLISDIIKPLKCVRKERQIPGHKIVENKYDPDLINKQKSIILDSYKSIKLLRLIFLSHPKARDFHIPEELENGIVIDV